MSAILAVWWLRAGSLQDEQRLVRLAARKVRCGVWLLRGALLEREGVVVAAKWLARWIGQSGARAGFGMSSSGESPAADVKEQFLIPYILCVS